MIEKLLGEKLASYAPTTAIEQEHVLAELMQHYVLAGLARAGLFTVAFFHGGTSLRILHGMRRFSEDLDFMLRAPRPDFRWQPYLESATDLCAREGIRFELQDRAAAPGAVKKAFLKTDSIGKLLTLELPFSRDQRRIIRIKLEIDTHPPAGSAVDTAFLRFPVTTSIAAQALPSGFGTKSHALLCREYVKGRDWYDLLWYIDRRIAPDLPLLEAAIEQTGPWAGQRVHVSRAWYLDTLAARIDEVDWAAARDDVARFVPTDEQENLALWGRELFHHELRRLGRYW